jgi:hypothetical protein
MMPQLAERPDAQPASPAPVPAQDGGEAQALLGAVLGFSPYRKALAPLLGEIARVALANRQVRAALAAVEQRADFRRTGRLSRADLGAQKAVLLAFLENVHFASPDFLRSVGEWPLGEIRDRG